MSNAFDKRRKRRQNEPSWKSRLRSKHSYRAWLRGPRDYYYLIPWKKREKLRAAAENAKRTAKLLYEWRRAAKPRTPKRRAILNKIARRELERDDHRRV